MILPRHRFLIRAKKLIAHAFSFFHVEKKSFSQRRMIHKSPCTFQSTFLNVLYPVQATFSDEAMT